MSRSRDMGICPWSLFPDFGRRKTLFGRYDLLFGPLAWHWRYENPCMG